MDSIRTPFASKASGYITRIIAHRFVLYLKNSKQRESSSMSSNNHQELLKKYAEAIVKVGLNIRAGQRLIINNATSQGVTPAARTLVHEVSKAPYAERDRYVQPIWGDEEMMRIRLQHAPADS